MGYISTTHYFFVNYDNDQKRILVNNNLISDEYLSLEEFKRKCWEQILLNGYFHYTPVPNSVKWRDVEEYHLTIGAQDLFVACDKYPEIHEFFQNAYRIYMAYQSDKELPSDISDDEKNCFLLTLKENHSQIAIRKARHDVYTPMLDYFDSIYNEFDKEKISRKIYNDYLRTILIKITKLTKINDTLLKRLDDIKYSYDLNDEDVEVVFTIKEELASERGEYDDIIDDGRSKKSSYSHLGKLMELLNIKVLKTEEKLEVALRSLGSLKEDELRAREQLDEMKQILESAKSGIKSFKLPMIPENYFVELGEATEAIANMVQELEKTPISIKVLNTRVDTARDLVLKVYNTTKETVKTAKMAETAIVYGNRYRPINTEVDIGLSKAEKLFFQGKFKNALETAIHAINIIEPGIYKKLMDEYQN